MWHNLTRFSIFIVGVFVMLNCQNLTPLKVSDGGKVNLTFNFVGKEITQNDLKKLSAARFTRILIAAYQSGNFLDPRREEEPVTILEIELAPQATRFEGQLNLPAGSDWRLVVSLFEAVDAEAILPGEILEALSYTGRRDGITVLPEKVSEITINLFPVPIPNRRVVLWAGTTGSPTNLSEVLPIGIATMDSLRGIQFDLEFNPPVITTAAVNATELAKNFSDLHFNNLPGKGTRILLFDQTANQTPVVPLVAVTALPEPLLEVILKKTDTTNASNQIIQVSFNNGIVNAPGYRYLEVFAVPGEIHF